MGENAAGSEGDQRRRGVLYGQRGDGRGRKRVAIERFWWLEREIRMGEQRGQRLLIDLARQGAGAVRSSGWPDAPS